MSSLPFNLLERDLLPDSVIRTGIRRLLEARLREEDKGDPEAQQAHQMRFVEELRRSPVAIATREANEQHYELPSAFFGLVLGRHLKYSSCYFKPGVTALDDAEAEMLRLTCVRAGLVDGEQILELGCGWGSLTLWMAEHFPRARITAVSNSRTQKQFIDARAVERGLANVEVLTRDANVLDFPPERRFDRVVSVEMFEHMRNWRTLFGRVHDWLAPGGRFFMHVFCHRSTPYLFVDGGPSDWMSRYFFSGGMMPSDELPLRFQDRLRFLARWRWDGSHYERTANAWLANVDARREAVLEVLEATYGEDAAQWLQRWRVFFMACAELFGYAQGQEWWVSHYLFERPVTGDLR